MARSLIRVQDGVLKCVDQVLSETPRLSVLRTKRFGLKINWLRLKCVQAVRSLIRLQGDVLRGADRVASETPRLSALTMLESVKHVRTGLRYLLLLSNGHPLPV